MMMFVALSSSSLLLLLLFNQFVVVASDGDWNLEEDVHEWIDPHSMVYDHDRQIQKRKQEKLKNEDEYCSGRQINCAAVEQTVAECKQRVEKLEKNLEEQKELYRKAETVAVQEQPFFNQYLNQVLLLFTKAKTSVEKGHYETDIMLSTINYQHLFDYITFKNVSIQEVHHILSSMMMNVQWVKEEIGFDEGLGTAPFFSSDVLHCLHVIALGMIIMVAAFQAVSMIRRINISLSRFLFLILFFVTVASFVISIPWTWWHLYKIKVAERLTARMSSDPVECRSKVTSLWRTIASIFVVQTDRCQKYMEDMEIDPLWEVPPTQAVAVTLTRFFLEPASYMGRAVREFMMSAFEGLPLFLWVPVYGLIVMLIVLILFCCCRYRVYTPLLRIEPAHHNGADADQVAALRQQVLELQNRNRELEQDLSARDNRLMLDGRGDQQPDTESTARDVPRHFQIREDAKEDLRPQNIAVKEKSKDIAAQKLTINPEEKTSPPKDSLTNEINSDMKSSDFEKANQRQESDNNEEAMGAMNSKT